MAAVVVALVATLGSSVAAVGPAATALPWERTYVAEESLSLEQQFGELVAACGEDLERGTHEGTAVGVPEIAVVGDSISSQTRGPLLSDPGARWVFATRCGERFGSALDSGRVADALVSGPDVLVVALGINDIQQDWQYRPELLARATTDLGRILDATDAVPCRVLVNVSRYRPGDGPDTRVAMIDQLNASIAASTSRPGVHLADWAGRLAGHDADYLWDGVHLTRAGINARINLVVESARQCQVPDAPAAVGAAAGNGTATVWWDPLPTAERVTSYRVVASDGRSVTTSRTTVNFPGLPNGAPVRFRVEATNAVGSGPASPWTAEVVPTSGGARFHAMAPIRVLDSRNGTGGMSHAFGPGETYELPLGSSLPEGAQAAVLNVTAAGPSAPTFVTVWPGAQPRPLASNLNPQPGVDATAAMVTSRVGPGGSVQLFNNSGTVHLVADLVGYYGLPGSTAGSLYAAVAPTRVLDSRNGTGGRSTAFGAGTTHSLRLDRVPADASAVVLNVTATNTTSPGFVTISPGGAPRPLASNLNPQPSSTRANLTISKLGPDRRVDVYNSSGSTDLVADLLGYYTAPGSAHGGAEYFPITPERVHDTRNGTGGLVGPVGNLTGTVLALAGRGAVPATGVTAVDANVTVVGPTAGGHTTIWPEGTRPTASNLNYGQGETVANRDIVTVAGGGALVWSAASQVHYVVDVSGWFGPLLQG